MRVPRSTIGVGIALYFSLGSLHGQAIDAGTLFTKRVEMVPMRDGVRLHTEIYTPKAQAAPLPFIFERTPYSIRQDANGFAVSLLTSYKELADEGYIFVYQDVRGKFNSEGTFILLRPARGPANKTGIDESTDAYDTIEWLVKNVPNNNGRVGMLGISYGGWLTTMALLDPHPALRAASPQAPCDDMWLGDDFHHNGAFRLSYGFEYVALMEAGKQNKPFSFASGDTYEWFLRLGGLSNADQKYFHGERPTWNEFVHHPDYDQSYWQPRRVSPLFKSVTVPTLNVAGWWDQEDFFGPVATYEALEKFDTKGINYLVVGPWNHGGWARGEGSSLGAVQFDSPTAKWYRENVQARWFAYWLKDKGAMDFPEALTFRAGANQWERHDSWPLKQGVTPKALYFHSDGKLSFDRPSGSAAHSFDAFISDPTHPVPYRSRPIAPLYNGFSNWPVWLTDDQRHAHLRPDVLSWATDVLDADVTIAGRVVAKLFASTTGSDADWVVKLIDVYPGDYTPEPKLGGYQLMVSNDVFRGRYRKGFAKPEALVPNKVTEFTVDLHTQDYTFKKGHAIMVQVQSTWFPLIDRNPQKYVPNIYQAKNADYIKAEHRVYRSGPNLSRVEVAVVTP